MKDLEIGEKGFKVTTVVLATALIGMALAVTVSATLLSAEGERDTWFGQAELLDAKAQYDHGLGLVEDSFWLGIHWAILKTGEDWDEDVLEDEINKSIIFYTRKIEELYQGTKEQPFSLESQVYIEDEEVEVDLRKEDNDNEALYIDKVSLEGNLTSFRTSPDITIKDEFHFEESYEDNYTVLYEKAQNLEDWFDKRNL